MSRSHRLIPSLAALALLSVLGGALAAGTPAGTVISNQAAATADAPTSGDPPISVLSNLVSATVSPVCSVSVTPDGTTAAPGQSITVLPQEGAAFSYRVLNTGNTASSFSLDSRVEAASAFTPGDLKLFLDANDNGQLDPGEASSPVGSVTLAPDRAATVFLSAATLASSRGDAYLNLIAACQGSTPGDASTSRQQQRGPVAGGGAAGRHAAQDLHARTHQAPGDVTTL